VRANLRGSFVFILASLLAPLAPTGAAAQVFLDLEGSWIARVTRADKGAIQLEFGIPEGGVFGVTGRGFTAGAGYFFAIGRNQTLRRDPIGRISGTLLLVNDAEPAYPFGTLEIEDGKTDGKFGRFSLSGVLTVGPFAPLDVKLKGVRPDANHSVLAGATTGAKVSGPGIRSDRYDLVVLPDPAGYPVFTYGGLGPLLVDGVDQTNPTFRGRFILDDKQRLFGTFDSTVLGPGVAGGRLALKTRSSGTDPVLKLKAETPTRKMRVTATLHRAVTPALAVSPPGPIDLGAVQLASSAEQVFAVLNSGAGVLRGEARFADGGDPDFTLLDDTGAQVPAISYEIEADAIANVRVRFTPTESGARTAVLEFTGAGLESRVLNGIGADLIVVPVEVLEFPNTEVGMNADLDFTVTNVASNVITGEATLPAGAPHFTLREGGEDVTSVAYSLEPGQSTAIAVRFQPEDAGDLTGAISFSGGSGATRTLTGAAIAAP
jgi:hypothetical protein